MKKGRAVSALIAFVVFSVVLVFGMTACENPGVDAKVDTSQSGSANLQSSSDDTASQQSSAQDRIAELEAENAQLQIQITELHAELERLANQQQNSDVEYMVESIFESIIDHDSVFEMYSAEIQDVKIINHQFQFDIIRHRPGWGWEVTLGEEDEGYPVEDSVMAKSSLIYLFNSYQDNMDALVNEVKENPSPYSLNFLMVNDMVVWISEEKGP